MKKKGNTQMFRVLRYMKNFHSITRAEAMSELGIANLPAVINTLRNQGVSIITDEIEGTNRFGEKITYAKYKLGDSRTEGTNWQ